MADKPKLPGMKMDLEAFKRAVREMEQTQLTGVIKPEDWLRPEQFTEWLKYSTPSQVNWIPAQSTMPKRYNTMTSNRPTWRGREIPASQWVHNDYTTGGFGLEPDYDRRWHAAMPGCDCWECNEQRNRYIDAMTNNQTNKPEPKDQYGDLPLAITMLLEEVEGEKTSDGIDLRVSTEIWTELNRLGEQRWTSGKLMIVLRPMGGTIWSLHRYENSASAVFSVEEDPGQEEPVRYLK